MDFFSILNQDVTMSTTYIPPHKRFQKDTSKPPSSSSKLERHETLGVPDDIPRRTDTMASRLSSVRDTEIRKPQTMPKIKEKTPIIIEDKDESEEEYIPLAPTDDGWTVVEKKVRVKRDKVQEALDNGDAPLSDEEEEQSFWDDQPEEFETYWDRKP
jgi:hypothetical protein